MYTDDLIGRSRFFLYLQITLLSFVMLTCFILIFCKVSELQMQILFGDSRWTQGYLGDLLRRWWRAVCESERVRGRKREGGMEAENADANCDVSALSWHDCVTFQRRTPSCSQREGEREREGSVNNAHWALWGSSWWDMQWPKGNLFSPERGASHYPPAFIRLEVDGWSVFILK